MNIYMQIVYVHKLNSYDFRLTSPRRNKKTYLGCIPVPWTEKSPTIGSGTWMHAMLGYMVHPLHRKRNMEVLLYMVHKVFV